MYMHVNALGYAVSIYIDPLVFIVSDQNLM